MSQLNILKADSEYIKRECLFWIGKPVPFVFEPRNGQWISTSSSALLVRTSRSGCPLRVGNGCLDGEEKV